MELEKPKKNGTLNNSSKAKPGFLRKIMDSLVQTKPKKSTSSRPSSHLSIKDLPKPAPEKVEVVKKNAAADSFDLELQENINTIERISEYLKQTERTEVVYDDESVSDETCVGINSLPIEILNKIFDYLDFGDRKNASLVCKKWRNAYLESFLGDIMIKANNHLFVSSRPSSSNMYSSLSLNKLSDLSATKHRAASTMALSAYSSTSSFNIHLYSNVVNLDFENDSADVALLIKNLQNYSDRPANEIDPKKHLLPRLKNLKFHKTTMSSKTLIEILKEAPRLERLYLIQCDSLFMSGFLTYSVQSITNKFNLTNLTELSLSKNRYLTDFLLNLFLNSAPNLKLLDISYCLLTKVNYKSVSNRKNGDNGNLLLINNDSSSKNLNGSSVVLTIENLIKVLKENNLTSLNAINLSGIELVNHDEMSLLSLIECLPKLESIYLANLPSIKADTVMKVISLLPILKQIDLTGSIQVNDSKQRSIELCLEASAVMNQNSKSNIEVLKVSRAIINDPEVFLQTIPCFTMMTYLDMSCTMFQRSFPTMNKVNQYIEGFAQNLSQCDKIEHLILSYCDFLVSDSFIKIIAKKLKKLKHLDLKNCTQITDESLHHISTHLTSLTLLDISWCQNVSDYGLSKSIQYNKDDKLLNEFNNHLNSSCRCLRKYTEQPFLLLKTKAELANKQKKDYCTCNGVNLQENDENQYPLEDEPTLSDNSPKILDENVSFKNLKYLKILRMESCVNISDIGLYNGINLSQLQELDIKLCTNVSGNFINSLLKDDSNNGNTYQEFNNLKTLNLNQCIKFEEENLIRLIENSPNLKELNLSAITSVTNRVIQLLLKLRKLLILLDVSFCPNINESWVEKYEQFLSNEFGSREFHLDKRFISK